MPYQIPGATAVGITFDNGIVLGAEKRVSYGTHLVSRSGKKVFKVNDKAFRIWYRCKKGGYIPVF